MKQPREAADTGEGEASKRGKAFTALPDDLACDVDRAMAYLRNHQAKQRIRLRLKQHAQDGEYRSGSTQSAPPA